MKLKRPTPVDVFMAIALYVLNVIDFFCTSWIIRISSPDMELNPFIRGVYMLGPWNFMVLKVFGGLVLTAALLFYPISRKVSVSLIIPTVIYFGFTVYHLLGLLRAF